jgi:hypothetical protein
VFSRRVPSNLTPNRLSIAVAARRRVGAPIIDLTESNPTRAGFEYPSDLLRPLANCRGLVYEPQPLGLIEARRAVAADYARRGVAVDPARIVLTASTSEAYSLLFKLLAGPGDEVLVPRPSYPLFEPLARLDAVAVRPYDLEYHGVWSINFATVESAIGPRTRALLVVNPNNPTGSFVSHEEFGHLTAILGARDVALIADEVFIDYPLGSVGGSLQAIPIGADRSRNRSLPEPLTALEALAPGAVLTFTLGGLSKSIGLPQVKLGWFAVSGPDRAVSEALSRLEHICDTYLSVSAPVQLALSELLERGAAIRDQIAARVVANYRRLKSLGHDAPACRLLNAQGGWYAVVQVPSIRSEEDLVLELLDTEGVLVHPGYFFDFQSESFLVLSLLARESQFASGVERTLAHASVA